MCVSSITFPNKFKTLPSSSLNEIKIFVQNLTNLGVEAIEKVPIPNERYESRKDSLNTLDANIKEQIDGINFSDFNTKLTSSKWEFEEIR